MGLETANRKTVASVQCYTSGERKQSLRLDCVLRAAAALAWLERAIKATTHPGCRRGRWTTSPEASYTLTSRG